MDRKTDHEHVTVIKSCRFQPGWCNRVTRVREGIPEKLTFKLRYNYEEGAGDGKDRRNSTLVRGNGQHKDPETRKELAWFQESGTRWGEWSIQADTGDWQSRCEVPREKETQNSVVSVKIVCSAENVLYRGQERDRVPEGSTMLRGGIMPPGPREVTAKGKKDNFILSWKNNHFVDESDANRQYRKVGSKIPWDLGPGPRREWWCHLSRQGRVGEWTAHFLGIRTCFRHLSLDAC